MSTTQTLPLARLFRSEIGQAKRLGYQTQCNIGDAAVTVRLVPITPSARKVAARHSRVANPVLESVVPYPESVQTTVEVKLDCIRAGLGAVLGTAASSA